MLLMKLQSREKFAFLQLAHYLARVDNNFGKEEEDIILDYCDEMGIDNIDSFDNSKFDLEEILRNFKSQRSRKIVLMELMILVHIDTVFNINEQVVIEKISKYFDISQKDIENFSAWGKSVAKLYEVAKVYMDDSYDEAMIS
ncbi:TerB family tellurite resistance protein [Aliarcobacter skirrowii]|uniref:TerB family tellurite resistance protein n=1 Tax=Aliarcobacter skirrowii TaxID=28200 RepID=UPI000835006B|nr:TerB family tellurite resistance protein [Aliarcobacter skirrowii]MDX4058466.1 TerB family tellurite resistance protein [Aliarcobacter skirrowii]MDX4064063.1 TerB family tellurite resistance protein [Aliarcobacter skirrowii]